MGYEGWVTLGVIGLVLSLLVFTRRAPDAIMIGGLTLLMIIPVPTESGWKVGILTIKDALAGFGNEGMLTVAALFIVAAGLRETGATYWLSQGVLGHPKTINGAMNRLMWPTAAMSAFVNNTPLVAMLLPVVGDWGRRQRISVSKLMIPLSYASILGGICTLIGTSTNLVVNGWLVNDAKMPGMGMFDIAWVGVPCAVAGTLMVLLTHRWLLPERKPVLSPQDDAREYTVEMMVEQGGPLVGRTIEDAGLRHLPGLYLMEIERSGQIMAAVSSNVQLTAGDRLVFVGIIDSVKDLQKIRGLGPATSQVYKLDAPRVNRCLVEAVVSDSCPIVGMSIREGGFRSVYNAAVIAVARNGERIKGRKIGDIVLRAGDTLLLEARASFAEQHRDSRDFYLVSSVADSAPPRHDRAWIALLIMAGMVFIAAMGWVDMIQAALIAGLAMIATRCCNASGARRSIDWQLLIVIATALGLGRAVEVSGAAKVIAHHVIGLVGDNPYLVLGAIYLLTMAFTEVITNNAAAVLVLPIAFASATSLGVNPMPFVIAIMIAASASFATPIGYQTNLMVYGPGGYRFTDYARIGIPISALLFVIAMIIIPMVWPFN
ncbi:MAG: SLC13 family permease [Planctomycetes bacterium]|nr:SLC13 family permease [Planctomycetota bacterium]